MFYDTTKMASLTTSGKPDDPQELFRIGIDYYYGNNVRESPEEAFRWISMAAERDHAGANCVLGMMYSRGYGTERSLVKAVEYLTRASEQDLPQAQYELGLMYHTGVGVEHSDARAAELWKIAAEKGYGLAQYALALLYDVGSGVPVDRGKAFKLYIEAANQDVVPAKCRLGLRFEEGIETGVSYPDALRWFREAADEGDARALFEIGWMTYFGLGCRQSETESKRLIEIAVRKGVMETIMFEGVHANPYSQLRIGWLYDLGWGVEQSTYKAIAWYTGAKIMGLSAADRFIEDIESRCGPATEGNAGTDGPVRYSDGC